MCLHMWELCSIVDAIYTLRKDDYICNRCGILTSTRKKRHFPLWRMIEAFVVTTYVS